MTPLDSFWDGLSLSATIRRRRTKTRLRSRTRIAIKRMLGQTVQAHESPHPEDSPVASIMATPKRTNRPLCRFQSRTCIVLAAATTLNRVSVRFSLWVISSTTSMESKYSPGGKPDFSIEPN